MFSDYDIGAFEERILAEYIENKKMNDDNFEDLFGAGKLVASKAVSGVVGSRVAKLGDLAILRANRLAALAKYYDGGHQSRMRVQRSFRGKTAQNNMMKQISLKGKNLSKMSDFYKKGGSFVKGRGVSSYKNAFRPITPLDALKHLTPIDDAPDSVERNRMRELIPEELAKYCEKNNNYRCMPKYSFK